MGLFGASLILKPTADLDERIELLETIPAGIKYTGGGLANSNIYMYPSKINAVGKITISTDIYSIIGPGGTTPSIQYQYGAKAENGFFYCAPYSSNSILKINPNNDTFSNFGTVGGFADNYTGANLAQNGMIYLIPRTATSVGKINPTNDTYTTVGTVPSGSNKYFGGVLAENGFIYCIPLGAANIGKIDPSNDTFSSFGSLAAGGNKYSGGVLAENGFIYCIPLVSGNILKINPTNDTFITIGTGLGVYAGGQLAANGKIYCPPAGAGNVLVIDPTDDSYYTLGSGLPLSYNGAVISEKGEIYGIANDSTQLFKVAGLGKQAASANIIPSPISGLPTSQYNKFHNKA